jgi:translation initiation factor 1
MKLRSLSDLEQLLPNSRPSRINAQKFTHDGKGKTVRIFLDTKGRKGKSVTIVAGLQHNPATMEEIERILKQYCGAGGTIKEGNIEIQGDQRRRVAEKMKELNYVVKG